MEMAIADNELIMYRFYRYFVKSKRGAARGRGRGEGGGGVKRLSGFRVWKVREAGGGVGEHLVKHSRQQFNKTGDRNPCRPKHKSNN